MSGGDLSDQSATVVISHLVKVGQEANYEQWLDEIVPVSKSYPGHMGVQIIRPVPGASVKYTIIIRYDTRINLLTWMESEARRLLIEKAKLYLADDDQFLVQSGLDFWFTPEAAKAKLPTRWKQFLVTWSAIFPLVLLTTVATNALISWFGLSGNFYLKTLVITGVVVTLMVYVVMPKYTKLVAHWLFR
jgi:hypothetical protein